MKPITCIAITTVLAAGVAFMIGCAVTVANWIATTPYNLPYNLPY